MSTDSVLVLGATGKTRRRLVPRLRMRGVPVRATSRSSATASDWSEPAGWDEALRDIEAVYVVPPAVAGPVHEFVDRAGAAGVRRLVLQSGHAADSWGDSAFGRDMLSAENAVRGGPLEWTVLRPANFDQNFDEELHHAPLLAGGLALPVGDVPEPFIDIEDVADVAALVPTEPGRHADAVYELTAPRSLTFAEAVELIASASGLPLTYRQISPSEYTETLMQQGLDEATAGTVAAMFEVLGRGVLADTSDQVATLLGRPPRTFEDYVVRAASASAWR